MDGLSIGDDVNLVYKMTRRTRGRLVIINNKSFDKKLNLADRPESDVDAASLCNVFTKMGFTCKIYINKTREQMLEIIKEVSKEDHTDADCFACTILTHGDETHILGTDGAVKPQELFAPLKGDECPSLLLKPKLFFLQACRGVLLDPGTAAFDEVDSGAESNYVRVPIEADCLYAYSTVSGFASLGDDKGSLFIQALCKVLSEWGTEREIMAILTRVNHMVAYELEYKAKEPALDHMKQTPSIVSQLTKRLYFPLKQTVK